MNGFVPVAQKLLAITVCMLGLGCAGKSFANLRASQLLARSQRLSVAMRWEQSVEVLDRSLSWNGNDLGALMERGRLLTQMGLFQKKAEWLKSGQASLETAARISPRDQEIARALSSFYRSSRQYSKAEEVLQQIHAFAGYQDWHLAALTQVRLLQGKLAAAANSLYDASSADESAKKSLPRVLLELEANQAEAGVSLLKDWISREGDAAVSLGFAKSAAELALQRRNPAVAGRFLGFVLESSPADTQALYMRARVNLLQGEAKQRWENLEKLAALASEHRQDKFVDMALLDLAQRRTLNLHEPAFRALEKRLKAHPESAPLRLLISRTYLKAGKVDEATELIAAGLDISPEDSSLLCQMGTCLVRQGLGKLARSYFEQALRAEPGNVEARQGLAHLKGG